MLAPARENKSRLYRFNATYLIWADPCSYNTGIPKAVIPKNMYRFQLRVKH